MGAELLVPLIHFLMIAVVVVESLCGILCPLTSGRTACGNWPAKANEPGSFIGRWLDRLLFVDVSPSVLAACYCVFGLAVLLALFAGAAALAEQKNDESRMTNDEPMQNSAFVIRTSSCLIRFAAPCLRCTKVIG